MATTWSILPHGCTFIVTPGSACCEDRLFESATWDEDPKSQACLDFTNHTDCRFKQVEAPLSSSEDV